MKPSIYAEQELCRTEWFPADKQDFIVGIFCVFMAGICAGMWISKATSGLEQPKREARR